MSSVPQVCSACGAASAWDARYCQQCGRQLREAVEPPRYYGVLAPGPAFALGAILLVAALLALIAGSVVGAIVLLALALTAFVFFYGAARRKPEDPVAGRVFASGHHLRGWATFARASTTAWARALRDDFRLRRESRSLRREREPALRSLGDAVYRHDEPLVEALRERIRQIDDELAKRAEERSETVAAAHRQIEAEREAAQSTQAFSVEGDPEK